MSLLVGCLRLLQFLPLRLRTCAPFYLKANLCTMRIATATLLLAALVASSCSTTVQGHSAAKTSSGLSSYRRKTLRSRQQQQQLKPQWLGQVCVQMMTLLVGDVFGSRFGFSLDLDTSPTLYCVAACFSVIVYDMIDNRAMLSCCRLQAACTLNGTYAEITLSIFIFGSSM